MESQFQWIHLSLALMMVACNYTETSPCVDFKLDAAYLRRLCYCNISERGILRSKLGGFRGQNVCLNVYYLFLQRP